MEIGICFRFVGDKSRVSFVVFFVGFGVVPPCVVYIDPIMELSLLTNVIRSSVFFWKKKSTK